MIPSVSRLVSYGKCKQLNMILSHSVPRFISTDDASNHLEAMAHHDDKTTAHMNMDEWFRSIMKPLLFYEEQANIGNKKKHYFYNIDLQGRVFLEETYPKNMATSIKDPSFLKTLFKRLRRINSKERDYLMSLKSHYDLTLNCQYDYPFVSPCGVELNFVRPADLPIVFHSITPSSSSSSASSSTETSEKLYFGKGFSQPFVPSQLNMSKTTGRLYHPLLPTSEAQIYPKADFHKGTYHSSKNRATNLSNSMYINKEYGLIQSSLLIDISDHIILNDTCDNSSDAEYSGIEFHYQGSIYPIMWLPMRFEPGAWSYKGHDE